MGVRKYSVKKQKQKQKIVHEFILKILIIKNHFEKNQFYNVLSIASHTK